MLSRQTVLGAFLVGTTAAAAVQYFRLDIYPNMRVYEPGHPYLPTWLILVLWPTRVGEMDMEGMHITNYAIILWLLNGVYWDLVLLAFVRIRDLITATPRSKP